MVGAWTYSYSSRGLLQLDCGCTESPAREAPAILRLEQVIQPCQRLDALRQGILGPRLVLRLEAEGISEINALQPVLVTAGGLLLMGGMCGGVQVGGPISAA